MSDQEYKYIGRGIYTVPDIWRFTNVTTRCIRCWHQGTNRKRGLEKNFTPNLLNSAYGIVEGVLALSFVDLIEVLVVGSLRKEKVSLQTIRAAHLEMQRAFDTSHPFSTHRILTDGKTIFTDIATKEGDKRLLHILKNQYELRDITLSFLKSVDFDKNGFPQKWWPMNREKPVVIDPKRSFGQPIVQVESVPTLTIAKSIRAEKSIPKVANWYNISLEAAESAYKYEMEYTKRIKAA